MSESPTSPMHRSAPSGPADASILRSPRIRFGVALALGGALVAACGGSPTSAPGQGAANLPPQTNPGVADKDKGKGAAGTQGRTLAIKGQVVDVLTGEPVEKAMLFIEGVTTTVSSTPIPAAPSPGKDELDTPGGDGDAQREPFDLAQADDPLIPDAETTISPPPGGAAAASPGASAAPGTSPAPGALPLPGASASAAAGATSPAPSPSGKKPKDEDKPGAAASVDPNASPAVAATPYPANVYKIDSRGRFELKDLPEGSYNLTFWAPGYQATTIQGGLPAEIEVPLRPIDVDPKRLHEMKGVVRQANNQPAGNVEVEVSSVAGKAPGVHESTDDNGNFAMKGLYAGNYAVAAWTTNLEGEVETFSLVKEVPVSLGRERRTVSPTLILRAVTTPVLLAGTVEGSAKESEIKAAQAAKKPVPGIRPVSVRAYITVGDGEIPIATANVGKDGYFRLRLPQLPDGANYHLVASGQSDSGQTAYAHEYDLEASDPKMTFKLPAAPEALSVLDRSKHPRFSWEPVGSDVSAYRVAIEKVGQEGDTVWEGWTTGTGIGLPKVKDLALLREGESYRYSLAAVKLADDKKMELISVGTRPWAASGITKPATFEVVRVKPGQKPPAEGPVKPLPAAGKGAATPAKTAAPTAPTATPAAKASGSPAPSAKPTPKNPRTKPIDDI